MKAKILVLSLAALMGGTTFAAAQVYDNSPGWEWQRRGIIDSQGVDPNRGSYGYYDDGYRAYGYVPRTYVVPGPRWSWQPDDPPGSRYQDRGIQEWDGGN